MKQGIFQIAENTPLTASVFRLRLAGDTSAITAPGQFVNMKLDGCFLRRPVSVCDAEDGLLTVVYKVVGRGTEKLSRMEPGDRLDVLTGLGNGFDTALSGDKPLLIGGGVGLTPLYFLAKELIKQGKKPSVVLGFNSRDELFYEAEFKALRCAVTVTTVDGSASVRGFVTDALPAAYSYFYACGPEPMRKAVCEKTLSSGQLSFEARMGCGFGACMGCTCQTIAGPKRICRDGPVLRKEEVLWRI